MKKLFVSALLLAISAATTLAAESLPFVTVGKTYTVMFPGDAPVVITVTKDEGKGWYRARMVNFQGEAFLNLANAAIIASDSSTERVDASAVQKTITNNLRLIANITAQHFLETGKKQVALKELVGPGKSIREIKSIDGEDYLSLVIEEGRTIKVKTSSGKEYSYEP